MFEGWLNDTPKRNDEAKEKRGAIILKDTPLLLLRRTDTEVFKLVQFLRGTINASLTLKNRVMYFWPTPELLDHVLFTIAGDIPKSQNPLWARDSNEDFKDDRFNTPHPNTKDNDESQLTLSTKGDKRIKKRRDGKVKPKCVEWLGLINEATGFASIKLTIPATQEPWVTWTNRIITFLFAHIPAYAVPEDFIRILKPPSNGPLKMRCDNPRCVRLAHTNYLPDDMMEYEKIETEEEETTLSQGEVDHAEKKTTGKKGRFTHGRASATGHLETVDEESIHPSVDEASSGERRIPASDISSDTSSDEKPKEMGHREKGTPTVWSPGF